MFGKRKVSWLMHSIRHNNTYVLYALEIACASFLRKHRDSSLQFGIISPAVAGLLDLQLRLWLLRGDGTA